MSERPPFQGLAAYDVTRHARTPVPKHKGTPTAQSPSISFFLGVGQA